jgi:cytochrome bd-type quinol oxidase subunit 1
MITLNASVLSTSPAGFATGQGTQVIPDAVSPLHSAAASELQIQTTHVLIAGMLMILAAFLSHAAFVIRTQREPHSRWNRVVRWFQKHLDYPLTQRHSHF